MRIFINTFGSRGDVQPYVALGKGLAANGHEVTVCTASSFETFIIDNGLNYGYVTNDLLELMDTDVGREAVEDTAGLFGSVKTMIKLVKATMPLNRQMMSDSWDAAQEVEPDLVIYHPKTLGSVSIAEVFNAPAIMAILQPMMVPTAEFPTIGLPTLKLGGWYNKATYKAIAMGYNQYGKTVNRFRQENMGLQPFPKSTGIYRTAAGHPIPVMHGISPQIVPPPADWPSYVHVTGYWFLNQESSWEPNPELSAFLDTGDAPVYIGFGSMSGKNPQRLANIVVEALQQTGKRGIIATGWGGLAAGDLPDSILKIEKAPHDWLFPRMAAVVHHGGAGTTAAGLRAGRPTLICPFMGDQPMWGDRVFGLGAGPKAVPQKKLSVEKLAQGLQQLTEDAGMRQRAQHLGEKINAEDGVATVVRLIEQIMEKQN